MGRLAVKVHPGSLATAVAIIGALAIGPVAAQTTYTHESLEWLAADADLIVRGRVAAVARTPMDEQRVRFDLTLAVDEVLKGQPGDRPSFSMDSLGPDRRFDEWKA